MHTHPTPGPPPQRHSTAEHAPPSHCRLPALDGLRGVAILLVMAHHLTIMPTRTTFDAALKGVLGMGVGVELFFVLSGFLITSVLLRTKTDGATGASPAPSRFFGGFYLRRALRIFPLYYLVLAAMLVIVPRLSTPDSSDSLLGLLDRIGWIPGHDTAGPWFWLHLSNIPMALRGSFLHESLDVTWSLAVQEQFYLVWPVLVYLCSAQRLRWVCLGLITCSVLFRTIAINWHINPVALYVATPARLDSLAVGSLIAVWHVGRQGNLSGFARSAALAAACSAIVLVAIMLPSVNDWHGTGIEQIASIFQRTPVAITLVAACFGGLLVSVLSAAPRAAIVRILSSPLLTTLGRYSFAMFLFHQPIRALVRRFVLAPVDLPTLAGSRIPGQLAFYAICVLITLVAAIASWHLYERPFLRLPHLTWRGEDRRGLHFKGAA